MNELIERLKKYKKKAGISDEKIAQELGISHMSVNRWMNGYSLSSMGQKLLKQYLKKKEAQKKVA